jgi:hypothetical protein
MVVPRVIVGRRHRNSSSWSDAAADPPSSVGSRSYCVIVGEIPLCVLTRSCSRHRAFRSRWMEASAPGGLFTGGERRRVLRRHRRCLGIAGRERGEGEKTLTVRSRDGRAMFNPAF